MATKQGKCYCKELEELRQLMILVNNLPDNAINWEKVKVSVNGMKIYE